MVSLLTGLLLGLLLGMRHALEPDHLAAVSTLVGAPGRRSGAALGAAWGLGHAATLLGVGCVLAALQVRLPRSLADGFEALVGVMLVVLGMRALARARRAQAPDHHHHVAPAPARPVLSQPVLLGLVHGLAGSGALAALVLAEMPTPSLRVAYMVVFGAGSILGMALLTGLAGWPLARLGRSARFMRGLAAVTGAFSLGLGSWWAWAALQGLLAA